MLIELNARCMHLGLGAVVQGANVLYMYAIGRAYKPPFYSTLVVLFNSW